MSGETLLPRAHRQLVWTWTPLIAVAIGAVSLVSLRTGSFEPVPVTTLLPASWLRTRPIEARVSGLAWIPFVPKSSATLQNADPKRGASFDLGKQKQGVIALLGGDPRDAVATLEQASAANEPAVWNDLAAAYYEAAIRHDAPEFLADALAAADRALTIEPRRREALFNRALILQRLGLRTDARSAWSQYLMFDSASGWANEARTHLEALAPERPFLEVLDGDYDRISRDPAAAEAIYVLDPFGARGQGVVEVLGRWGQSTMRHDEPNATRHLNVARQLGHVVARRGDRMLEQAVAAIDRAGDDRAPLAAAHADFHAGMKTYQKSEPRKAEPLLRRAGAVFRRTGSPMAIPAFLWAAICVYDQGRRDESEHEIEVLLASTPAHFQAYRGFMLWQLGNARKARGEWGAAIAYYEQSAAIFEGLGEPGNVANVRRILATVYDKTGDSETAWKNRLASLNGQGIRSSDVDERTVWYLVEAAIVRRDWYVASSFLKVYVEITRRLDDEKDLASALLLRAVVRDHLDDARGVREDFAEARLAAARVDDASYQEMLRAMEWRSLAMLRATPPAEAESLLTKAIEYESARGLPSALPGLLLLRARARRGAGNVPGARDDVENGIQQLERHRESLPPGAARWGAFHEAEELFDEAMELAMIAGDAGSAFRFSEKARARSLLDAYGAPATLDLRAISHEIVVIEYATLPAGLIIFVADASGLHAVRVDVTRDVLAANVNAFVSALQKDESSEARDRGLSLFKQLVEPIASRIAGAATVVFVPDDVTSTIPFAALVDTQGDYLLQHHAIVVAPSASAFVLADEHRRRMSLPRSVLVVTASASAAGGASLPLVDREAKRILGNYRNTFRIDDRSSSQVVELLQRAAAADIIHFGGHAIGDPRGYEPASIVLGEHGVERRLGVAEIAKMRLPGTAVVVLAGCNTARGQRRAAEGVISVAHGFLFAGAPSAIATLWPISDESAALFFPRLHEKLASGMPAAEALREVQLEVIRRGDIPASLWAAVQDIGS
ncbi:MAG TPA: CHAT domain-containing tetratricopeptide repeat protein [Thermoanaerobaculia bacterium]|nr:CHAT domain-containing tetratricopeptide repeat protein [Thermoanaerobaculia bacterium]